VALSRIEVRRGHMDETSRQEGLASQATAKVEDAASAAQEKASELREQSSARLRDQFDQRSTQAGSQVRSLAKALRHSGNELGNEGNRNASQLTTQAADRLERVGSYLEEKSGDELMREIETFARRRPWLLAGIGMMAGVAAARFMKASSEQRYGDYRRSSGQSPTSRSYEQAQLPSRSAEPRDEVRANVSGTRSDDPLVRDPSAGTR
jgi:ElaB/YqjD/DUF883 family membrane-anchored ribosome-binding protein